jgi:hypothetical protein
MAISGDQPAAARRTGASDSTHAECSIYHPPQRQAARPSLSTNDWLGLMLMMTKDE